MLGRAAAPPCQGFTPMRAGSNEEVQGDGCANYSRAKSAPTTVRRRSLRHATVGYAFILPALLLYIIFFIYPFVVSILL